MGRGLPARRWLGHLRSHQPQRRRLQPDSRRRRSQYRASCAGCGQLRGHSERVRRHAGRGQCNSSVVRSAASQLWTSTRLCISCHGLIGPWKLSSRRFDGIRPVPIGLFGYRTVAVRAAANETSRRSFSSQSASRMPFRLSSRVSRPMFWSSGRSRSTSGRR
jgi:hypothetical protein